MNLSKWVCPFTICMAEIMTMRGKLNGLQPSFCTPFGVSQVVCDAHLHLLAPWAPRLFGSECCTDWEFSGMAAPRVNCPFTPTHQRRVLDRLHVPFFKSSVWPGIDPVYQLWWRVFNQLGHLAGVKGFISKNCWNKFLVRNFLPAKRIFKSW